MRVNVDKLRGKIMEKGLTQEKVAGMVSMDRSTFSRKMKSEALEFSIGEMHRIADILSLTREEASQIFLA
ncbi:MAG: helix-turn-helix domain-containing protein [Oscillospiraceae bacterium]|nr:helix-turn-helix domain-containing protein [Oscillospiraceae bacterium]